MGQLSSPTSSAVTSGTGAPSAVDHMLPRALLLLLVLRALAARRSGPRRPPAPAPARSHVRLHAFGRAVTLRRSLSISDDAALYAAPRPEPSVDVLLELYSEVCTSWRALVDVRFKLLGLVPAVSAVLLATLLLRTEQPDRRAGAIVAVFGLVVTAALALYDQRNSQLHDELISRGRRIEYELGMVCGQFLGRPGSRRPVQHDVALALVYASAAAAWVAAAVHLLLPW